jgi:murein DD-endopeptidase MepM/ murein hydrolase activator NlpD
MLHCMGQHACEFRFILSGNEQTCRHEYVPAWQCGGFVDDPALIVGSHAEREWELRAGHIRRDPLAERTNVALDGRAIEQGIPTSSLLGQELAERGLFLHAVAALGYDRQGGSQQHGYKMYCHPIHYSIKVRWILPFFLYAAYAQTFTLPEKIRQGGTLRVHGPAAAVTARMDGRTVRLFPQEDRGSSGLMPIPADQKPGAYQVELLDKEGAAVATAPITVVDAHFPKQNVVIAESLAELKPSPGESETSAAFRNSVSDVRYWSEPLAAPVRGCMTSPFGVRRYLNGKPTGDFHGGLDQRSPAGAPVHAAAGGVVKIVREWNLHGHTVGIDHGQGLESMYLHLSKFAVAEGATVQKGDVIGYVGSTGRSTAPHLHWTIYVNGVPVNPLDWIHAVPCAPRTARKQ